MHFNLWYNEAMEFLPVFGRILFGSFFVLSSLNHFLKSDMLAGYAASKGVSSPKTTVLLSGLLILLGGLGIVFNMYIQLSVALVALFLLGVSFNMHKFWKEPAEMENFTKNMALLGAALMLL